MAVATCRSGHPQSETTRTANNGCRRCRSDYQRERRALQRLDAIAAYGGACSCCGETEEAFLQFDHVNNNGKAHREEMGGTARIVEWLRRNGYPSSIQLLCANCNMAKYARGGCPHLTTKEQVA